ncbi:hypothetical protein C2G38_2175946 [Gigaspora rosea]|uniref:Uncharacterized protein n=1 Tax=Gigaspora rosea TaxID=44941 RepID=A0A397VGT4_9GLOM|nr:hypothetical protein C2G38_2175946 [Gigaspora rosea]
MSKRKYPYPDKKRDNYNKTKTISFCEIEETNNDEVYTLVNVTPQRAEKRLADSKWEGRLRKEVRMSQKQSEKEQNMEIDNLPMAQDLTLLNKTKRKCRPSKIDSLNPYNVADDILALPTSATVGQILQYPNQRRNLAKILKWPTT